jgi:hypothetical protein
MRGMQGAGTPTDMIQIPRRAIDAPAAQVTHDVAGGHPG